MAKGKTAPVLKPMQPKEEPVQVKPPTVDDRILDWELDEQPEKKNSNEIWDGLEDVDTIQGDNNLPQMELSENIEEIMAKQELDDLQRKSISDSTEHYVNGKNEWRLIAKTENKLLGWEHVTTAMQVGSRGVLIHVKEAIDQKVNATTAFVENGKIEFENGKYFLK